MLFRKNRTKRKYITCLEYNSKFNLIKKNIDRKIQTYFINLLVENAQKLLKKNNAFCETKFLRKQKISQDSLYKITFKSFNEIKSRLLK